MCYATWVRMSNSESARTLRRRAPVPKVNCALAAAVEDVGDRWMLLILREAFYGVMRYDDIRADLGIPRAVLSDRLTKLVDRKYLEKRPYREAGDRQSHGYVLTAKGQGLALTLIALTHWSETFILAEDGPIEIVDQATGCELRVALVNPDGAVVPVEAAMARVRSGWTGTAEHVS